MGKKGILLVAVVLLGTLGVAQAQIDNLGVDVDLSWVTRYMFRGYDRLDDKAAFQPSINLDLFDTGVSFKVWASYPGSSQGYGAFSTVNRTEYRYIVAYDTSVCENEVYATDIKANYILFDFIDEPSLARDAQEIGVAFSWPNALPYGIVPSYYVGKIWESRSASTLGGDYGGWVHIFGLAYDLTVPGIVPEMPEHVLSLTADITYNDGYASATADHDWSHATIGVSTPIPVGEVTFTPALYYQLSMDDSVNDEDELWAGFSLNYSF